MTRAIGTPGRIGTPRRSHWLGWHLGLCIAALVGGAPRVARPCSPSDFPTLASAPAVAAATAPFAAPVYQAAGAGEGAAWSTRAPLTVARQEVAVAELEGLVYVVGGIDGTPAFLPSVEVYDPATDSWSTGPALPVPLHHTTATAVGGKLYVIGGWSDYFMTPLDVVYELDPAIGSWVSKSHMPTARGSPAAAALDGSIYVAGGWRAGASVSDFAVYDPAADAWQGLPSVPTARNHLGLAAADGHIYAVGGRTLLCAGCGNVATVDVYDPVGGAWSPAAPLPRARGGLTALGFGRFVFAFGGEGNSANPAGVFEDADVFDPDTDAWTPLAAMPTPRHGIGAAALDGAIHIPGGGPIENFGVSAVHEVLDAALVTAQATPALALPALVVLASLLVLAGVAQARRS